MVDGGIETWTPIDFVKVGGGLTAFATAMLVVMFIGRAQSNEYTSWIETPCEILGGSVLATTPSDRGGPNRVTVMTVYRYSVDGQSYENEDFGTPQAVDRPMDRIELDEFITEGGAVGTTDHCFVDPADPSRSVFRYVEASDIDSWFKPVIVGWLVCALIAGFGVFRRVKTGAW